MSYLFGKFGMSNLGNTSGTSGTVNRGIVFAGGNNITLSQSVNASSVTLTISAAAANQTVQTQNLHNVTLSGNTAGVMAQVSSGTLTLAGGNNVTLSQNANAVTISAANQTVQTQNLHNVTLGGNTAGVMAQVSSGTLTLAGGNNVTLSQNGNAVTISAGAGGGGGIALANSQTTYTSGTANLTVAGGAMTIASTTGQSFNFSVPQTSSLSATGLASISTNGSTISIGVPTQIPTLSRFEYPEGIFTALSSIAQGSLSINHMYVPFNVTGTAMKIGGSLSGVTNTSATTASVNMSLWMGIYTLNGSTLSLASSGSANNGFQWSQSGSTANNSSINSMRQMTVPMNVNMTPGEYWVGAVISSATTYTSAAFTIYGNNLIPSGATNAVLIPIGSHTSLARDAVLLQGVYTAATAAGPTTIVGSQINNTSASNVLRANFYNAIYNATY